MEKCRHKTNSRGLNASTAIKISAHFNNSCIDSNNGANYCASILVSSFPVSFIFRLALRSVRLQTNRIHHCCYHCHLHAVTNLLANPSARMSASQPWISLKRLVLFVTLLSWKKWRNWKCLTTYTIGLSTSFTVMFTAHSITE
jgi:hypothetical protein